MSKELEELMNKSDDEIMSNPNLIIEDASEENKSENADENSNKEESDDNVSTEVNEENNEASGENDKSDEAKANASGSSEDTKSASGKSDVKNTDTKSNDVSDDKKSESEDDKTNSNKKAEDKTENNQVTDYKAAYDQIMQPFRANGREIKLNSPEEVIKLMQLGANYVKKMQAIQPNLKVLRMLENNQMLDEGKLGEMIDVMKGDKTAIAKFVKDRNIDPMDIDPETAVDYKPGNHKIADSEINFQSTIEDIGSSDAGQNLIIQIQHSWDKRSKEEVFKEPAHLRILEAHMRDGIYDQIAGEVEKQKALGHPEIASMPFIMAYERVGKALAQNGLLKVNQTPQTGQGQTVQDKAVQELGRGTAPNKKAVDNSEKAKAASPSAKSTKRASAEFNPLSGSDDEFLKSLANRV